MSRNGAFIAVCFCAGMIGALANTLVVWLAGDLGITTLAGVAITPELTLGWLYPRLVWGGIWGLPYFLTVGGRNARRHWVRKGLWISLLPTLAQLLIVFPRQTPHGLLGLGLGTLTPLFVLGFNFVWGFFTALSSRLLWGRG